MHFARSKQEIFLKIVGIMFLPLLLIITVIITGFTQIEKQKMINFVKILEFSPTGWIFLCFASCAGIGIGCYVVTRCYRNHIQSEEQLAKYQAHLEELAETLRMEQQKNQQYLNITGSIILGIDEDQNIQLVNKAGLNLLGYDEKELIGQNWIMQVVPQHYQETTRQAFQKMIATGNIVLEPYEGQICLKDGTEKLIAWRNMPLYDHDGRIIGVLASGEDITEQRKTEKELRKLSQAVEQSPVSVLITNRYGQIEYVNQRFSEKTNYRPEEVIGKNPRILKSGNLPQSFYKELWQTILSGEIWRGDFLNKTKEGNQYWERASISSIMDVTGTITNFIAIKEDITEQKKMEEQLLQAKVEAELSNKAKGNFLANMSHEIRTPMNAVIGLTHLALQSNLLPKQQDYLEKIAISAQSLLGIIDDILDYSKFAAGKLTMENIQFNLWKVIEDVNTMLNCKAEEKGLEIVLHVAKDVPMRLRGDPHRLKQILLNLLSNAVKFTHEGEVTLAVKLMTQEEQRVQLEFIVRDSGIGMSDEEKSRLFNVFTQADGSTTRKYGGTGLGLVISKQLVEMMGGAMHVKSSPNQGSEFVFTAEFDSYEEDELVASSQYSLQNLKVLVIDDNESSCLAFKEILEKLMAVVSLAPSGEEGIGQLLEHQNREPFDLILLDWMMPDMDGIETARRIRNYSECSDIPIIMVTSSSGDKIKQQGGKLNVTGFLMKPVTPSALFNAVVQAVGKEKCQNGNLPPDSISASVNRNDLHGARILLVEDNKINLQVAREILEKKNMIVTIARNGREAIELVREQEFDGVLMDIQMPEMDGLEATSVIRNELGFRELPIIAMTADVVVERVQVYLNAGMKDCIFKPINVTQMLMIISKWITPQLMSGDLTKQITDQDRIVTEESIDFQLMGINVESALLRLGGNQKLYHKLLLQFLESNEETMATLHMALLKDDYPGMEKELHSLKGAAGNIGADDLYATIRELEVMVSSRDVERIKTQMDCFAEALFVVMNSLRGVKCSAVTIKNSPVRENEFDDFNYCQEVLKNLQDCLANYDMEAGVFFEKLKTLSVGDIYQLQFEKIQILMDRYEYEKALEQLQAISNSFHR